MLNSSRVSNRKVVTGIAALAMSAASLERALQSCQRPAFPADLQAKVNLEGDGPDARRGSVALLTGHEMEIVRRIVRGYNIRDIAGELECGEAMIKCDLSSIFQKLGVSSRLETCIVRGLLPARVIARRRVVIILR